MADFSAERLNGITKAIIETYFTKWNIRHVPIKRLSNSLIFRLNYLINYLINYLMNSYIKVNLIWFINLMNFVFKYERIRFLSQINGTAVSVKFITVLISILLHFWCALFFSSFWNLEESFSDEVFFFF